jgi:hypothetical protein
MDKTTFDKALAALESGSGLGELDHEKRSALSGLSRALALDDQERAKESLATLERIDAIEKAIAARKPPEPVKRVAIYWSQNQALAAQTGLGLQWQQVQALQGRALTQAGLDLRRLGLGKCSHTMTGSCPECTLPEGK